MQLGMMNDPRRDAVEEARRAARLGFEFLDLTVEPPGADSHQIVVPALRHVLDGAGMGVVGHTAWFLPFASPYAAVRRAAVEVVATQLPLFAEVGATIVNVHIVAGVRRLGEDAALGWNGECFAQLAELAAPYQITIVVEHPPEARVGVGAIQTVLAADPRLGFHLDIGHAHVAGRRLDSLLSGLGHRLRHVHASDNRGRADDHIPLGAGEIDWPAAVRALRATGYDGTVTLEVFAGDDDYVALSARKFREWWRQAAPASDRGHDDQETDSDR